MTRSNKIFFLGLFLLAAPYTMQAQTAAEYLPAKIGSTWRYQRFTTADSLTPITASKTIETDSLAGTKVTGGVAAYVFRNRTNTLRDSTTVSARGDSISYFNGGFPKEGIKLVADSLGLGFLPQVPGWYTYVKLLSPPLEGRAEILYQHDSTITVDGTEFDLTLVITRTRKPAGVVVVPAGTFNAAVPFVIDLTLDWWVFSPLGRKKQPLLKLQNVIYIANNNWVVKETQYATKFPLTATNNDSIPKFSIPGYVRVLEKLTPTSVALKPEAPGQRGSQGRQNVPGNFALSQNYPNPFNGTTAITLDLEKPGPVTVRITDLLGRTIETMPGGCLPAGRHQIRWNSGALPSGVYFYRVDTDYSHAVKRMVLQK